MKMAAAQAEERAEEPVALVLLRRPARQVLLPEEGIEQRRVEPAQVIDGQDVGAAGRQVLNPLHTSPGQAGRRAD